MAVESTWRRGNRFTLVPDGKRYIPEMLRAIDEAQDSILLEQYLVESGDLARMFIDALAKAARRGVKVYTLFDSYGAQGLKQSDRDRLTGAGVALAFFNPPSWRRLTSKLARDHRKLLLVDHRLAFTGGFCITDDFLYDWYDVAVTIEGPVVEDWFRLFARLWTSRLTHSTGTTCSPWRGAANELPRAGDTDMPGRVIWGRGRRYQAIRLSLQQRIAEATERVWLYTPYFLPTMSLRRHLREAARRGVDVRLLVAGKKHDHPSVRYAGKGYYGSLLRAGVRIYEYQPAFTHAKFCLVDRWCTIGSCNFDHWSLRWNLEANQEVDSARFAADARALFEDNLAASKEIRLNDWAARPWWQKLVRRLLAAVSAWATMLR